MSKTPVNYTTAAQGGLDLDDLFIRRALFTHGGSWAWGEADSGQLGDNSRTNKSSPVQTVAGGTNWKTVACGYKHAVTIKTDGSLWTWGGNSAGQLGNNAFATVAVSSPIQTVSGGTNWKQLTCGFYYTVATKTDGSLWLWGSNSYGQLGNNSNGNTSDTVNARSSPVQTVSGGTNWKFVTAFGNHVAAIKTDGSLWIWGANWFGALGDNTSGGGASGATSKSSPVQTVSGGTNWQAVGVGQDHTAAIKTDGTLWTWGRNDFGQLGHNTTTSTSSPVQTVASGTNWKQVVGGTLSTAAIKTDGTLWVWGNNDNGTLGDNSVVSKSSPVQTVSAGTNWKYVTSGYYHIAAIKTDGTLWTWGYNTYGGLGDNSSIPKSSPVQTVAGGTNWKHVASNFYFTAAIIENN